MSPGASSAPHLWAPGLSPVSVQPPHLTHAFCVGVMLPPKGPEFFLGVKNLGCCLWSSRGTQGRVVGTSCFCLLSVIPVFLWGHPPPPLPTTGPQAWTWGSGLASLEHTKLLTTVMGV